MDSELRMSRIVYAIFHFAVKLLNRSSFSCVFLGLLDDLTKEECDPPIPIMIL